jgi:hypothetical protein
VLILLLEDDQAEERCGRNRSINSNSRQNKRIRDILNFYKKENNKGFIIPLRAAVK